MGKQTLRPAERIPTYWRLVIKYTVAGLGARIERPASMASALGEDANSLAMLPRIECPTWSARRDQFASEWARSNADSAELVNARLRVTIQVVGLPNLAFNAGSIGARFRTPVRVDHAHSPDRILRSRFGYSQTRRLTRLGLNPLPANPNSYRAPSALIRRVPRPRFPISAGSGVRHDMRVASAWTGACTGPLPAIWIAGGYAWLIGIEVRPVQRDAVQSLYLPQCKRMPECCLQVGQQTLASRL